MIKYILIVAFFLTHSGSFAQENPYVYQTLSKKNFYFLHAIENNSEVKEVLIQDKSLSKLLGEQKKQIAASFHNQENILDSLIAPYLISKVDSKKICDHLNRIYNKSPRFKNFIENNIRNSGAYVLYDKLEAKELIENIWKLNAEGINHILNVYGMGKKPQYATIDSVSYDVKSDYYKGAIAMWSDHIASEVKEKDLWFNPSLNFALSLLYLNHRDEAARYEPLEETENKKTVENIKNIDFKAFPYASILILGNGPENYKDRLSALGKLNIKLGVKEYLKAKAPLIVVSGGHAHPFRAEYCEAIEMKKELINEYHIPENSIIIEPHARHTTTNLRNASRLYLKYGFPVKKIHLVVTNNMHSQYVKSENFKNRCLQELGYLPAKIMNRINDTTIEFQPLKNSLQQNPIEPLDP
ncbi:YdcF family protein [Zunongwangia pacifica]|uniref:YdcF family protein n=1 Tax=Zunongwangia pacifica TaxID=2911062 RepID=A0A9X2CL79_9FLAO|nr:YdcF family protein [Zunongwangia pacifica]MCL6218205.1 YdcF family protein [Zunongwangia pacifica]